MFSTLTDLCDFKEIYLNLHISISEEGIRKINLHFDITFNVYKMISITVDTFNFVDTNFR